MSFSGDIKDEIAQIFPNQYHCLLAEIAAIIRYGGAFSKQTGMEFILVETENITLAKKYLRLIKMAFDIQVDFTVRKNPSGKSRLYRIFLTAENEKTLEGASLQDKDSLIRVLYETSDWTNPEFLDCLLEYECCRRAYLRGAFLAAGSMSDPGKSYHYEIVCRRVEAAHDLIKVMASFEIHPKLVVRKSKQVVYLKDSTEIVDALNVMGAHKALMDLENIRIIKTMKNSANRQSNCDSANINKMVRTAARQLEDIRYIEKSGGFQSLTPQLREMAEVRLEHPDISLKELGEFLNPPVGKSGVNHRLKKLGEIAQELRETQGDA